MLCKYLVLGQYHLFLVHHHLLSFPQMEVVQGDESDGVVAQSLKPTCSSKEQDDIGTKKQAGKSGEEEDIKAGIYIYF